MSVKPHRNRLQTFIVTVNGIGMPTHLTARLAWHNDGWNGAICREPELNTYCVGAKSYPGDVIARERDVKVEKGCAGCAGDVLPNDYVPPCCYSYNAFGVREAAARSNPPDFFNGGADARKWTLPQATVCVWPYEAMYSAEVKAEGFLDNDKRRALTLEFFKPIEKDVALCANDRETNGPGRFRLRVSRRMSGGHAEPSRC